MAKIAEMYSCKALLPDGALRKHAALDTAFGKGPWLVVSPHDDDLVLGMGLTLLAAHAQKIEVHAVVVSDGRMGYVEHCCDTARGMSPGPEKDRAQRNPYAFYGLSRWPA